MLTDWQARAAEHWAAVETVTVPMRARKSRQEKHPVFDFRHTYYSFSLGRLERWHCGFGRILEDSPENDFLEKYSDSDIRHRESAPLRLPQKEIDALPLNKLFPTLLSREEHEQPGCIHANMDLYKWAYKSWPWISSELLRETLFFAIKAREIDIRASLYNLSDYGYEAI